MRLYLIKRTDEVDYDEHAAAVVRGYSETDARVIAAGDGSLGRKSFKSPRLSTCEQIGVGKGNGEVILYDFKNG